MVAVGIAVLRCTWVPDGIVDRGPDMHRVDDVFAVVGSNSSKGGLVCDVNRMPGEYRDVGSEFLA